MSNKLLLDPHTNNKNYIYIELINPHSLNGTVYNYFHFTYGFLFPLILLDSKLNKNYKITYILDYAFGPMDKIIFSLLLDIKMKCYISNYNELKVNKIQLKPMDVGHQPKYKKDIKLIKLKKAKLMTFEKKKIICEWFSYIIANNELVIYTQRLLPTYDIIFITRKTDPSYKSLDFKNKFFSDRIKKHGSDRRNINNSTELFLFLKNYYKNKSIIEISFDLLNIYHQYYLLSNFKLIVCQHGAALGNIVFMDQHTTLIEIIQKKFIDEQENWFDYYAHTYKLNHHQFVVTNEEDFFDIDIDKFSKFIKKIII